MVREFTSSELKDILAAHSDSKNIVYPGDIDEISKFQLDQCLNELPAIIVSQFGAQIIEVSIQAYRCLQLANDDPLVQEYFQTREKLVTEMSATGMIDSGTASHVLGTIGMLFRNAISGV